MLLLLNPPVPDMEEDRRLNIDGGRDRGQSESLSNALPPAPAPAPAPAPPLPLLLLLLPCGTASVFSLCRLNRSFEFGANPLLLPLPPCKCDLLPLLPLATAGPAPPPPPLPPLKRFPTAGGGGGGAIALLGMGRTPARPTAIRACDTNRVQCAAQGGWRRGAPCVVRGAWCVATWCVVRGAWCVKRGW